MPDADTVTPLIAGALIRQQARLDLRAIRFLRTAMGLTSENLARKVGVNRVEISRWENGKAAIDPHHDFRLRRIAVETILPEAGRAAVKEEIAEIFERTYNEAKTVSSAKILVPA